MIKEKKQLCWKSRLQLVFLLCLFLITSCCSITKKHQVVQEKGGAQPGNIQASKNSEPHNPYQYVDPLLTQILQEQYDMKRLFAWSGPESNGRVMWLDNHMKLQSSSFIKNKNEYNFLSGIGGDDQPFKKILDEKELGPEAKYLPDTDLPVQVDTLETGECQAKIIFLWRAAQRKFDIDDDIRDLAWPGLRVIVTKKTTMISSKAYDFEMILPQDILVADINGDGKKDYAFTGGMQSTNLYIWTLTNSCKFQPLPFLIEYEGTKRREKYLNSQGVDIKKEGSGYTIHTSNKVFLTQVYKEEIYKWNPTKKAFVKNSR